MGLAASKSRVFAWGPLAAVALVGCWGRRRGARTSHWWARPFLPLGDHPHPAGDGAKSPELLEQKPQGPRPPRGRAPPSSTGTLGPSQSRLGGSHRSRARFAGSFSLLSLPRVGSKQVCARSSEERSGFLTTLVLVPLVFKPTERTPKGQSPRLGHPACDSNHSLPKEDF